MVDAAEQLAGVTNLYQDNVDQVHLSSYAYAELGWHLSALFNNRDAAERKFSANGFYFPRDMVGYGALYADANAKGGDFITIPAGGRYFLQGYFDDEVLPVFHSYNTSGTDVVLNLQYAGNGTNRGVPSPVLTHTASVSTRQQLTGVPVRRGWRTVLIFNNGPNAAYIEAIEMRPANAGAMNRGLMAALPALAGAYPSANYLSALGSFWSNIDYSHKLVAPYRLSARCKIVDLAGIAVFKNPPGSSEFQDFLFAFRSGNDLYLRDFVGSTPTTTTAVGAFSAGTFDGEIEMVVTAANVKVYLDGVLKITYNSPVNLSGCPGVMSYSTGNGFLCFGAQAQGYVKGPY